jgi:hypothetical protein
MVLRSLVALVAAGIVAALLPASAADLSICGTKRVCGDMTTCAEAVYHNTQCGLSDLDRDGDTIPCETICGKTVATMQARMAAQPFGPSKSSAVPEPLAKSLEQSAFACGAKRTCTQMSSCSEATFYLSSCGVASLDRDSDGVPCEGLCR